MKTGTPAKTAPAPAEKPKDRIGLKLYNTIVIFDDYVVAKTPEAARETLLAAIIAGDAPMEVVAKEVTMKNSIRTSKLEGAPLVASDVTDEEFETLKGITNDAAFERFYTRRS